MVKCANGDPDCRSFKIAGSGIGYKGGRYVAKTPAVAAKRAGARLFQKIQNDPEFKKYANKTSIKFILKEVTKGRKNTNKTVAYEVFRKKLSTPLEITRNGKTIQYQYTYEVKRLINMAESTVVD
jgi:hypothetical protein